MTKLNELMTRLEIWGLQKTTFKSKKWNIEFTNNLYFLLVGVLGLTSLFSFLLFQLT